MLVLGITDFAVALAFCAAAFAVAAIACRVRAGANTFTRVVAIALGMISGGIAAYTVIDHYCSLYYGQQVWSAARTWDVRVWACCFVGAAIVGALVAAASQEIGEYQEQPEPALQHVVTPPQQPTAG